jgi:hypothetical protein
MHRIFRNEPSICTYSRKGTVNTLFISREDAVELIDRNPGMAVRIGPTYL